MMDESDDDFKELCATFLQRVKKNVTKEVSGERKTQKTSSSTQISKPRRTKPPATKDKALQGPREKTRSGSQAPRTKKQGAPKWQRSEPTPPENGEGSVLASAALREGVQSTQTEASLDSSSQPAPSCLTVMAPSPSKPRTAELVLQRMQQFKRADPERLLRASEERCLEAALEEDAPAGPPEEMTAGNGSGPRLPATESDAAVALALQQEFGEQRASAQEAELEEKGLFFCQICQKNLSAMNVTRREQHVNRCLDEAEKALTPSTPRIPECPICGKPFLSPKSRMSHLKQCAAKMGVGPQLLLQAVRLQTAEPDEACGTPASSFSSHVGGLKRKGAPKRKEPRKKRKVDEPEAPSEDLLVAMALSRSETERDAVPSVLRLESAFSERIRLGAEKKSRKRKAPVCAPPLLVQDLETRGRQTEDRVARLFAEETELSSTPPLPASRILKEAREGAGRRLQPPGGKQNFLWEGSALTGAWVLEDFYTASLVPPVVPQRPAKGCSPEPTLLPVPPDQPEPGVRTPPALPSAPPVGRGARNPSPSASQREHQALQDLVDLAREGLSATPWPCSRGPARSGGAAGLDMSPTGLPPTGFVLPPEEKPLDRGSHASLTLALLLADLRAMVDNPQLSDVQLQTDRGDVLYAHKFVLYARCPLLMQYVNSEGFSVVEDGDPRSQRVLLSDVSTEATRALLHYLYTADPGVPPRLAPDLSALAHRFGVSELVLLCKQAPDASDPDGPRKQEEDEDCESRAENFQELLRSMWVEEEEEAEALLKSESLEEDREKVNEAEMEEIYEFAATQRKLLRGEGAPEIKEETDQCGDSGPVSARILASGQVNEQSENAEQMESSGQKRGEAPARQRSMRQSTPPLLRGPCADEEKAGAPEEARGRSGSPPPAGGRREGRKEGVFWCSADAPEARPRSSTPRRCRGLAQIVSHLQEAKGTVLGPRAGSPCAPAPWQTPPWSPCLSQAPGGQSPGQSHPRSCLRGESPPPGPQPQGRASGVASRDSPAKRWRSRSLLTLLQDPGLQKGEERGSSLECRNKGILTSPEKSPSIDLTLSKPGRLSSRPQNTPPSKNRGDEIILLLDSDEELELEQSKIKSGFNTALEERKVLEVSPKSSELFSVIDIDADQEIFQSPARKEASLQGGEERPAGNRGSVGGRGTPRLSCDPESSPEEDSTTDTSWLVPATPLASRSRDSSSQTQVTGLRSRASVDHMAQVKAWTPLENRGGPEAARKSSVITPQMSSSCLVPTRAGSPDSQSPSRRPHPRHHQHGSPAPCPISVGLDDLTRQSQKHCPPGPSLLSQAIASEVVEVEDSEDEQEAASCRANSSSLLDGDPPIPVDDCHWHVEPLSPIPIDRLNLERTGPLSPGSPGRKAGEAPGSRGCLSLALLATAPARGSCAGQRKSQEKSPRAGSPGSSRPSALNSALCDDWDGEDQKSPEPLPRAQTPSAAAAQNSEALETPKGANRKNLPPKVPITPMPRYSIMETPVLKKELDRFGVRPLPKRQMVLKLKEIFQYTHQTLESDSENESRSSQGPPQAPHSQTHASRTSKAPRAAGRAQLEATSGPLPQRSKGSTKTKGPRHQKKQPGGSIPPMSTSPAREGHPDPDGDAQLPASQESVASSADSSDSSFSSLSSSSCEFGAAFESAEDAEGEEEGSAAQAAAPAAATEAALRHYIRSRPALYRRVLLYQPFELAELQAELKQHGLRVATQRLLDFLDAHCITFTTAAARKERLGRKRRQPVARRGAEPPGRSVPPHRRPAAAREAPQPPASSQASPALSGSGDRILPP